MNQWFESNWISGVLWITIPLYVVVCAFSPWFKHKRFTNLLFLARGLEILIVLASSSWKFIFNSANFNRGFLVLSVLLGHRRYFQCLLITRLTFCEAFKYSLAIPFLLRFYNHLPWVIWHYFWIALREELLLRAGVQYFSGNSPIAIIATATLFTGTHIINPGKLNLWSLFEFWIFAILLGLLFGKSESLLLVIGIHAIRNTNLTFYQMRRALDLPPRIIRG